MDERFVVREVEGFEFVKVTNKPIQLSVVVLDSAYCYATVAQFRSTTRSGAGNLGHEGARRLAHEHCDRLNAKYAA